MQHDRVPAPGTLIWIRNQRWRIERTRQDRHVVRLDVSNRQRRLTVLAPFDRPVATTGNTRAQRVRRQRAVARIAGVLSQATSALSLGCARDARIDVLAYQLEPALAVVSGARRILLADEVGLGKTIQAGLIIAELARRIAPARVLIVAPPSLRRQWAGELRDRFGLDTATADRPGLALSTFRHGRSEEPWAGSHIWIASADYLKQPHVLAAMPDAPWDLMVIDEAHDAAGDSVRREACDAIAKQARHVLLLTATPHSGDDQRFDRLLALGQLPSIDEPLMVFRRTRTGLGLPMTRRTRWISRRLSPEACTLLDALANFERSVLNATGDRPRHGALLVLSVLRKRALSTVAAFQMSLARRLRWLSECSAPTDASRQLRLWSSEDDEEDADERVGLTGTTGLAAAIERRWLIRLQTLAHAARAHDSKLLWLRAVAERSPTPMVVFTEFRHSLDAIAGALSPYRTVAVLHGAMPALERSAALDRFLDGTASVLVATDVGGQGLNLQRRAHWIINVELPWNPARLEQRIGRVDRIGQTRTAHASLLITRHPAESGLLAHLARRTIGARRAMGDDTLFDGARATELAVAEALFSGSALDVRARSTPVPLERSWRHRARAAAADISRRRHWRACWREAQDVAHRPAMAHWRPAGTRFASPRTLVIASVPIIDETGDEIERRAFVIAVDVDIVSAQDALAAATSDAVRAVVERRFRSRCRRLQRVLSNARLRAIQIDDAIAAEATTRKRRGSAAPLLFQSQYSGIVATAADIEPRPTTTVLVGTPCVEVVLVDRAIRGRRHDAG